MKKFFMFAALCGFLLSPFTAVDAQSANQKSDKPDKIVIVKDKNGNIKEIIVIKRLKKD